MPRRVSALTPAAYIAPGVTCSTNNFPTMALSSLPPELKLEVAGYLDPAASFNFAITCKTAWQLCQPILKEHVRLYAKWRVIGTSQPQTVTWKAVVEILRHHRGGWYTTEIDLPLYIWQPNTDGADERYIDLSEEDQDTLQAAVRRLRNPRLEKEQIEDENQDRVAILERELARGQFDALLTVLIHHLPNLKTLRLTGSEFEHRCLELLIWKLAAGQAGFKETPHLPLLPRLEIAAVSSNDTEGCCDARWMYEFLRLPSLRTFVANGMGGSYDLGDFVSLRSRGMAPMSNVTEVFLERCQFDSGTLGGIIAGIKALRKFFYYGGGSIVAEGYFYEPKNVIQALATHAGHSLERLVLEHESLLDDLDEMDLERVSLRPFKKLAILKCEWRMIWPEEDMELEDSLDQGFHTSDDEPAFDIRSILPESLQELYLEGTADDVEWDRLTEPFSRPSDATPHLTKLRIASEGRDVVGSAPRPQAMFDHPLQRLLDGHGYR
ncbi:hypothetical protein P153DRAFT_393298 [Dothidotthia symphoricarpi CBS 119687]|uniref:F-box domain-containing protein n=1 Tax=Dothidotthia symphoricarpi CBS 119687 TaxID=1392245 RepID=A0A6A6ASH2_9PLEO|nr:uncharacterized protein P153DRAFT_393298 [Dothidotthia symphoricarpi CBS 119687]KAF2133481.1 hypothetical protein P153DRAFT_393298 [Dothidotthia symphoricarpi CBS 119687]